MRTLIAVVLPRRFPYMFVECCVLAAHVALGGLAHCPQPVLWVPATNP